jgi:hypothetical protein
LQRPQFGVAPVTAHGGENFGGAGISRRRHGRKAKGINPNFSPIEKIKADFVAYRLSHNQLRQGRRAALCGPSVQQNKWNFSNWGGAE